MTELTHGEYVRALRDGVDPFADSAPTEDNTKGEISSWLSARGIEHSTRMTKEELLALVEED